jgi:hypothetical protein
VKEGYDGRRLREERGIIFWVLRDFFWLGSLISVVKGGSLRGALVCWGFWAWGPGYPYGIKEVREGTIISSGRNYIHICCS